jgi:hypothetical protein
MGMPQLVVAAVLVERRSKGEVARQYEVPRRWVITLVQRYLAEGEAGWVRFLALFRGFSQIMLAFSIRHAREEAAAIDPARPRDVSTCSVGTTRRRTVPALAA